MAIAREALQQFYVDEGLPAHGNLTVWFDWVKLYGVPVPLPNIFGRTKVLPYHDLHHIVTGYQTDEIGECEVGAWTLGTGGGPLLGHVYDSMTFAMGLIRFPERTKAAWRRGRRSKNLYSYSLDTLLEMEVEELQNLVEN